MELTPDQFKILDQAISASDMTLFAAIGQLEADLSPGIAPEDIETLIGLGQDRARVVFLALREKLCTTEIQLLVAEIDSTDLRKAILAIMDMLATQLGTVPAIYLAVLLSRGALVTWCAESKK